MSEYTEDRAEQGFTLIELLIAIVVVGILTAVAIVGIASLTNNGEDSACAATEDAVKAAQAVYYADHAALPAPDTDYPADLAALVASGELELSGGATVAGNVISGTGWTLTSGGGGAAPLTLTCA
ncbi:MAG: prepilin-type N-terminal cleavage/methylation domain-containing protein [Acidimicrobiia bacterium]